MITKEDKIEIINYCIDYYNNAGINSKGICEIIHSFAEKKYGENHELITPNSCAITANTLIPELEKHRPSNEHPIYDYWFPLYTEEGNIKRLEVLNSVLIEIKNQ